MTLLDNLTPHVIIYDVSTANHSKANLYIIGVLKCPLLVNSRSLI